MADKLCSRIDLFAGSKSTVNIGTAISAFTRDVATQFILGKDYRNIDTEDFNAGMIAVLQRFGAIWRDCEQTARAAIAAYAARDCEDKGSRTIMDDILKSSLPPDEKTFSRISDEIGTITGGTFGTTAQALRQVLYHVHSNGSILFRLRDELSSLPENSDNDMAALERLPYLTAVLMEGLRLSPGVATRLARIAPDRDLVYGQWRIPAGTPVGMTTLLMHKDGNLYLDPEKFNPERWMDVEARGKVDKTFAPFSRGTRVCLGMRLAWAELYIAAVALVRRFDFELHEAGPKDVLPAPPAPVSPPLEDPGIPLVLRDTALPADLDGMTATVPDAPARLPVKPYVYQFRDRHPMYQQACTWRRVEREGRAHEPEAVSKVVANPDRAGTQTRGAVGGTKTASFRLQYVIRALRRSRDSTPRGRRRQRVRAANCCGETELAARRAENVTMVALEARFPLYRSLGFKAVKNVTIEMLGGLGTVWSEVMSFGRQYALSTTCKDEVNFYADVSLRIIAEIFHAADHLDMPVLLDVVGRIIVEEAEILTKSLRLALFHMPENEEAGFNRKYPILMLTAGDLSESGTRASLALEPWIAWFIRMRAPVFLCYPTSKLALIHYGTREAERSRERCPDGDDADEVTRFIQGMNNRMLFLGAAFNMLKTGLGIQNVTAARSKRAAKGTRFSEMEHMPPGPRQTEEAGEDVQGPVPGTDKEEFSSFIAATDHMADPLAEITDRNNGMHTELAVEEGSSGKRVLIPLVEDDEPVRPRPGGPCRGRHSF
ncbi:hypothetical protein DL769_005518 [Monosporascus sp. CRB-8-3]|nr:hypothetical protein DL769_005518 [Monosporascus sp. CRB-8-3]